MDYDKLIEGSGMVINVFIILTSLIIFYKFFKTREKTYGLYMLLILAISDFLFPITDILTIIPITDQQSATFLKPLASSLFEFSLCWSAAISLFTYKILNYRDPFDHKQYTIRAFFACVAYTILFIIL